MSEIRQQIMQKLIHTPKLKFNQLWDKEISSNSFSYHLKQLLDDELIKKTEETYSLTEKGKQEAAYLQGLTGKKQKFPLLVVNIVIVDDDKILLQQRNKEPFLGYWGFPGGKVEFNQSPLEAAKEEMIEETGLNVPLKLKGIKSWKTYSENILAYNHQMFTFRGEYDGSNLIADEREGKLAWFTLEEIKTLQAYPDIYDGCRSVLGEGVKWIIGNRFLENGKFVRKEITHEQYL